MYVLPEKKYRVNAVSNITTQTFLHLEFVVSRSYDILCPLETGGFP